MSRCECSLLNFVKFVVSMLFLGEFSSDTSLSNSLLKKIVVRVPGLYYEAGYKQLQRLELCNNRDIKSLLLESGSSELAIELEKSDGDLEKFSNRNFPTLLLKKTCKVKNNDIFKTYFMKNEDKDLVIQSLEGIVLRFPPYKLQRAGQFYSSLFGKQFVWEKHGTGPSHLSAKLSNCLFELYPGGEGHNYPEVDLIIDANRYEPSLIEDSKCPGGYKIKRINY